MPAASNMKSMRILLILAATACLFGQTPTPLSPDAAGVFAIWPGTPPGSENWTWHEQTDNRGGNRMVRNVVIPTLTLYKPAAKANGAAVIIAPGGAFRFLMVDYEGVDLAHWLTGRGITAFVLRYRVMHTPEDPAEMAAYLGNLMESLGAGDKKSVNPPHYDEATLAGLTIAEEDGRQAIRYVRAHAADWSVDPHRIGIVGFSAGGGVVMGPVMSTTRPAVPISPRRLSRLPTATPVPDDAPPTSSRWPMTTNSFRPTRAPTSTWPGTRPANPLNCTSSAAAITASA